jgi:hypothetical protein
MPGIQSRGRNRNNINKIEQIKAQNKALPTPTPVTPQEKSTYQNKIAHGQQSHKSQNQIESTESNINKQKILTTHVDKYKDLSPLERLGTGALNQVTDYQGIVNWDHKSESVLNQSIEKAFVGDWEGAGKVIRENPYRFAGNLAVEVGTAFIPATWGLKAAKYGVTAIRKPLTQVIKNAEKAKYQKTTMKNENIAKSIINELPTVHAPKTNLLAFGSEFHIPDHLGKISTVSKKLSSDRTETMMKMSPEQLEAEYWFTSISTGTPGGIQQQVILPVKKIIRTETKKGPSGGLKNTNVDIRESIIRSQATEKFVREGISSSIGGFFPKGKILSRDQMVDVVNILKKTKRTEQNILAPGSRISFVSTRYKSTGKRSYAMTNFNRERKTSYKKQKRAENIKSTAHYRAADQMQGQSNILGMAWGGPRQRWTSQGFVNNFNTPLIQATRVYDIIKNKIPSVSLIKPGKTLEGPYNTIDDYGTKPVQQTLGQKTLNVLHKARLIDERQSVEGISLLNVKNQPFKLSGPGDHVGGGVAYKSSLTQDTVMYDRATSAATPESVIDTLGMHEPGHTAIDYNRGIGAKAQGETADASSGWDRFLYGALPGQTHKNLSKLNADKGKGVTVTKGVDALSSSYFKPSTEKTGRQLRRADTDEIYGMSSGTQNRQPWDNISKLDVDQQMYNPMSAEARDKFTQKSLDHAWDNRPVRDLKPLYKSAPFLVMAEAKNLQYDNLKKKNRYQKNKAKTQSFGGFGQFL